MPWAIVKNWKHVRNFGDWEFADPLVPGSGKYINGKALYLADYTRHRTGWPMHPHWSVGGVVDVDGSHGHAEESLHRLDQGCSALDFHFDTEAPMRVQYHALCCLGWTGIGIYPDWNNPGFHVDLRSVAMTQHWVCKTMPNGKKSYLYLFGREI